MATHTNKVVVLTGFSGAGKDAIAAVLHKRGYTSVIPHTTRDMRIGEKVGEPYHFINDGEFDSMIEDGDFAEHNAYKTMFNGVERIAKYGTSTLELEAGEKKVLTCGVQSTIRLKEVSDVIMVFLHVDDSERERRAINRGSFDKVEWDNRLKQDIAFRTSSDFELHTDIIISNMEDIDVVVDKLVAMIKIEQKN